MAVSKEDLIETLSNMSILEVTELVSELEEKWGVSAAAAVAAPVMVAGGDAAEAEDKPVDEWRRLESRRVMTVRDGTTGPQQIPPGAYRLAVEGRGIKQAVVLNTTFNGGADNLITRKYTIGFSASAQIKRSEFGIDSFAAFVGDDIDIELHGEFLRQ